jgi:hypothetical protein
MMTDEELAALIAVLLTDQGLELDSCDGSSVAILGRCPAINLTMLAEGINKRLRAQ